MAETINIAGKTYPRNIVLVVLAGGAAVVGYAWFSKGRGEIETETDFLVPEDVEPTGVLPFGGTQSGTFTEGPVTFRTDQEWYAAALDKLLFDYGIAETPTASNALDRYLAQQPLTAAQIPMINFVINSIGPPPSGARQIRQETAPGGGVKDPPGADPSPTELARLSEVRANYLVQLRDRQALRNRYLAQSPRNVAAIKQVEGQMRSLQAAIATVETQIRQLQTLA